MDRLQLFNKVSDKCNKSVISSYSTSFSFATNLLHRDIRQSIMNIYGFVRLADEIVDSFHDFDKKSLLIRFKKDTNLAINEGISVNPILQGFQNVVRTYNIDNGLIEAFFDSMFTDLNKTNWESESELDNYIYGSAEVVGLMCLCVFVNGERRLFEELSSSARALGAAFQKVNFLRDLKDDVADLNRSYFPELNNGELNAAAKLSIESSIEKDFEEAFKGIKLLPVKSKFGVLVAYKCYMSLFNKIRKLPPEVIFQKRVRINNASKLYLILKTAIFSKFSVA
ncbi:phytoene/squalene synthase family protein [Membranihabitans maritimus]|uniref:phytoene/squalene synthase family protein n=1 Tax=Membranihabitans maritimus TaxID=2904244 RepID=UPI001F19CE93|nr:phytoene/squalene synthase family protein [Membranihabitans maritimus]